MTFSELKSLVGLGVRIFESSRSVLNVSEKSKLRTTLEVSRTNTVASILIKII